MNRTHQTILDDTTDASAAAGSRHFALNALAAAVLLAYGSLVSALPTDGSVAAGNASIVSGAGSTTINQSSQNVVINWQSFSIGQGEAVRFIQPNSSSVALNRVLGADPSSILGSLSANGKVFLLNPNGILFGKGAQVNVGGLVASTLNISDSDFMAGRYAFSGSGSGSVLNQGTINADGGYVALLGANVGNDGVISARLGTVALAAGNAITLDVAGDGLLNISVNQGAVNALVQNGGLIQADGGQVLLTAQAAGALLNNAVNNTGVIQAQTIENHNGTIRLLSDMQAGTVNVGGRLDASAPNGGNGGFIETSAASVNVASGATITTAATQGQTGTWLIDPVDYTIAATTGDITGAQLSANLATSNVTILSSAGALGINGDIIVADTVTWSLNKLTLNAQNNININTAMMGSGTASLSLLYGQATAGGGASTYNVLAPINLPAGPRFTTQLGAAGVPVNYTVITGLGAQGSVTGTDLQGMSGNLGINYALGGDINAAPTAAWNAGAGFDPVGQTIVNPFTGNFDGLGHTITGLTILRPVTNNVGLFGYAVLPANVTLKNVKMTGGSVTGALYVGNLAGHLNGDILNSQTSQAVTGNGAPATYVGGVAGWVTGNITNSSATGTVTHSGDYAGGLVGWITGNITCCSASGNVTGAGSYSGGLAGWVTGNISRSYATGNVNTSALYVGGLAGWVTGNTSNSYATGSVATAGGNVGGLIGWNDGIINNSYSAGSVAGAAPVGGLVGFMNGGTVTNSFWDITSSGQALSAGGAGAVGMTTPNMHLQVNFTSATPANAPSSPSWDFTSIWTMVTNGVTYPSLQVCLAPATWVAVPAPALVPAPVVAPVASVVPQVVPPVALLPVQFASANLSVVDAGTPPVQLTITSPVEPPPEIVIVPEPVPAPVAVAPIEVPPVYVPPQRLAKPDRN